MKIWERNEYAVVEKEFDYELHEFDVVIGEKVVATITPGSIDEMNEIIESLDNGECVNGWDNGLGETIYIEKNGGVNDDR